jgi:hypothetical protein
MNTFLPKRLKLILCLLAVGGVLPHMSRARHGIDSFSYLEYPGSVLNRLTSVYPSIAANNEDLAAVLQKCLDLEALQPYYPKGPDATYQALHILQHGVSFPTGLPVLKAGKPLVFIDKAQLAATNPDAYFLFYEFLITDKAAKVDFVFNYDQTGSQPKMQVVSLELEKKDQAWHLVQVKIEGRAS